MSKSPSRSTTIFAPSDAGNNARAEQYSRHTLSRSSLLADPVSQFHSWFSLAQTGDDSASLQKVYQPETCTLATAELPSGKVSARMVYMKELDAKGGFVIYSNWQTSRKASDVTSNPWASLTFWWREQERQVRVEGRCERLRNEESQRYYDLRERGSRIGAWASQQSKVLKPDSSRQSESGNGEGDDGRAELERQVEETQQKFEGSDHIPVPDFWGGIRIIPEMIEFWQGRPSRLHDRFKYDRVNTGEEVPCEEWQWTFERLSP